MTEQQIRELVNKEIDTAIMAHDKKGDWPVALESVLKPAVDGIVTGIAKSIVNNTMTNEEIDSVNSTIYAVNYLYNIFNLPGTAGMLNPDDYKLPPVLPIPKNIKPH